MTPPLISAQLIFTGCGGNVTIRAGNTTTLLSPNFPQGYYANMRCEWTIFTDQTHRISLKIENFDLEGSPACAYDKVEIYQGNFWHAKAQSALKI